MSACRRLSDRSEHEHHDKEAELQHARLERTVKREVMQMRVQAVRCWMKFHFREGLKGGVINPQYIRFNNTNRNGYAG